MSAPDTAEPLRPVWLSHHYDCDADRCLRVGSLHLCRRCTAMLGGFVPAAILLSTSARDGLQAGDYGIVVALTIVAGIEFWQTVTGRAAYRPIRVLVLSPAVGAVIAWLAVTGFADGLGAVHLVAGVAAAVLLAVLFRRGTVVRRARPG